MFRLMRLVGRAFLIAGLAGIATFASSGSRRKQARESRNPNLEIGSWQKSFMKDSEDSSPNSMVLPLQRRARGNTDKVTVYDAREKVTQRTLTSSRQITSSQRQRLGWTQLSERSWAKRRLEERQEDLESARAILDEARGRVKPAPTPKSHSCAQPSLPYTHLPSKPKLPICCRRQRREPPEVDEVEQAVLKAAGGRYCWPHSSREEFPPLFCVCQQFFRCVAGATVQSSSLFTATVEEQLFDKFRVSSEV